MTMHQELEEIGERLIRRARRCQWDPYLLGACDRCHQRGELNILWVCEGCNFQEKMGTLAIHATPWALREVRRLHGHAGESSPSDREKKIRREAIKEEWEAANPITPREEWAPKAGQPA